MVEAMKSGVIGVVIGLITLLISLMVPTPWTLAQVMLAVGMASFFGPFGTALGAKNKSEAARP